MKEPKRRRTLALHRRRHRAPPPGSAPGTLVADPAATAPVIHVMRYAPDRLDEREVPTVGEIGPDADTGVTWIDVSGLADIEAIHRLGETYGIHGLALEDVLYVHQRPKLEEYDNHEFIVIRIPTPGVPFATEQIAIFLGRNYILTFQERPGDCFDPVRQRIRAGNQRIRESGADYLAYALIDAAIDAYFPVLEVYGEEVENVESEIFENADNAVAGRIHALRQDLMEMRRVIWSHREIVNKIIRDVSPFFGEQIRVFVRDCYDHTIQQIEVVETYREIAAGLIDLYHTAISTRMNEIMKVLTIIATIFIPLGFIASVYGMNFQVESSPLNMPELKWYWGYPFALGLMAAVAGGLVVYFRRKGWIGAPRKPR